jgi:hypothetical protein
VFGSDAEGPQPYVPTQTALSADRPRHMNRAHQWASGAYGMRGLMRTAITPGHPVALVRNGESVMVGASVADLDRSEASPGHGVAALARQSRRPAQEQPIRSNETPSDGRRAPVSAAS